MALGCVAHFPTRTGHLRLSAFAPAEDDPDAISLDMRVDQLVLAYYLTEILDGWRETSDEGFADGTFVSTSWSEAMSLRDWQGAFSETENQ